MCRQHGRTAACLDELLEHGRLHSRLGVARLGARLDHEANRDVNVGRVRGGAGRGAQTAMQRTERRRRLGAVPPVAATSSAPTVRAGWLSTTKHASRSVATVAIMSLTTHEHSRLYTHD